MELAAAALIWGQHIQVRAAAFISQEHDSKEFFFHDALECLGGATSAGKELPPVLRFCSFMQSHGCLAAWPSGFLPTYDIVGHPYDIV
jgi:hypothetical protein